MADPLSDPQIDSALGGLPGWSHERDGATDALRKTFELADFRAALAFIVRVGFEAEERDHHPELTNVYNRVEIALTTHDAGNRVTQRDLELAKAIESIPS